MHDLIRQQAVHSRLYTDPDIFAAERSRLFERTWLCVGHESLVAAAGDFHRVSLAGREALLTRDAEGRVHVLYNRCPHRGAGLCNKERGSAKRLTCPYHAWTFELDGRLMAVPHEDDYASDWRLARAEHGNVGRPAAVALHAGFVFARVAGAGPDLSTYLGGMAPILSAFAELSPSGRLFTPGVAFRQRVRANWKLLTDNLNDYGHGPSTHASSVSAGRHGTSRRLSPTASLQAAIMAANGAPYADFAAAGTGSEAFGHSFQGPLALGGLAEIPELAGYVALLRDTYGTRAEGLIAPDRHMSVIYPSLSVQIGFQYAKILRPVAVDLTEVEVMLFRVPEAPDALWRRAVAYANLVNSPASPILVDDWEMFERTQRCLAAEPDRWVSFARGAPFDREEGDVVRSIGTSELPMRGHYAAWAATMRGEWPDRPVRVNPAEAAE